MWCLGGEIKPRHITANRPGAAGSHGAGAAELTESGLRKVAP